MAARISRRTGNSFKYASQIAKDSPGVYRRDGLASQFGDTCSRYERVITTIIQSTLESEMFERVKKDDDNLESQDTARTESEKGFGSLRSKVANRGGDAAGRAEASGRALV